MAGPKIKDRARDTTTTTGTGSLTLALSPPTSYQGIAAALTSGDTCCYALQHQSANEWEVGIGTYTSPSTLARTTVLASSNAGSAVNLSSGTKDVWIDLPADFLSQLAHLTNTYANLAAYLAGRVLLPSDGIALYRDTGSALAPWGPLYPLSLPVSGDFSWVNQDSATLVTTQGGILLSSPHSPPGIHARVKTAPSTPYTITALLSVRHLDDGGGNQPRVGLLWRDSASGKIVEFGTRYTDGRYGVSKWDSVDSFNSGYITHYGAPQGQPVFWRIADDGTNRKCSMSLDGQNWNQVHTVGRTDFLTPNEVGFFVYTVAANTAGLNVELMLHSWKEG